VAAAVSQRATARTFLRITTMKIRGLLLAAVVLAALTGTLYWSNRHKPSDTSGTAAADVPPKILTLNQADISGLEIRKKGGEEVTLAKDSAGQWQITAPKPFGADQDAVSGILSSLSSLNSDRLVEDKANILDQYGLTQPAIEVDITTKDKKIEKLLIGDNTPASSGVYAAMAGEARVFILAAYNRSSFDKGLSDLRDKRLLTFDSDKVSRVELSAKKQNIEFGRDKNQWQILKPKPLRADQSPVDDLVRALRGVKMDLNGTEGEKKTSADFNSGTAVAVVKVTDVSGTQQLRVRKSKDDYLAKSSVVAGVYKVTSALGTALDKGLDDYRNKKLFDFGYVAPEKVEIHDGAKSLLLSHSGSDWWSNGTKMDENSVSALLASLWDFSASKFLDSGFTTPMIELTVTSNDGKRIEKVILSKNGDRYVAKRENEPALYELEASSVTGLQKLVADVKPSVAPKK
jgi:hypothetical protein